MVDTNSDPREVDFAIPSNDDASKSIEKIVSAVANAIVSGLSERKAGKDDDGDDKPKKRAKKVRNRTTNLLSQKLKNSKRRRRRIGFD